MGPTLAQAANTAVDPGETARAGLLIAHALASVFMTGLIWFVQVVHYPLMARVPAGAFPDYERAHQARTTLIVAPVMAVEAATALGVALLWPGSVLAWSGVALLAAVWGSTFLVQVPLHGRLARGHDAALVRRLVLSNWARTLAWSARGVIACVMLARGTGA